MKWSKNWGKMNAVHCHLTMLPLLPFLYDERDGYQDTLAEEIQEDLVYCSSCRLSPASSSTVGVIYRLWMYYPCTTAAHMNWWRNIICSHLVHSVSLRSYLKLLPCSRWPLYNPVRYESNFSIWHPQCFSKESWTPPPGPPRSEPYNSSWSAPWIHARKTRQSISKGFEIYSRWAWVLGYDDITLIIAL